MSGDVHSFKLLIDAGNGSDIFKQDIDGYTAIHAATQFNHCEILEFCFLYCTVRETRHLDLNQNWLDATDNKGRTALHWACFKEHSIIIEWLLSHGADPLIQDEYGDTPLHIAAKNFKNKAISTFVMSCTFSSLVS